MRKREIVFVFAAALVILLVSIAPGVASIFGVYVNTVEGVYAYHEGWYHLEDGEPIPIDPPETVMSAGRKETVTIYHDVTEENAGKWLLITTSGYGVRAYADGVQCYESEDTDSPKYGKIPTSGLNYIQIPEDASQLALEFTFPYKTQTRRIPIIYIGSHATDLVYLNHTVYQYHHFMDLLIMFLGVFVCLCAVYCFFVRDWGRFALGLYLGLLLLFVGWWLRIGTFDVEIRRTSKAFIYICAYRLWYGIPVLVCGYSAYLFSEKKRRYRLTQLVSAAVAIFIELARNTGLFEYAETVILTHIELIVVALMLLWDGGKVERANWKQNRRINFRFVGLVSIAVFGGMELIYYAATSQPTGLYIRLGIIFCVALLLVDEVKRRELFEKQLLAREAEQRSLQMQTMLSQMQPHFIFNALGAIRLMIHMDSETAYDMIYDFSHFLRANFRAVQSGDMIPFAEELAQIKAYMNIENKRFNNRVQAKYEIQTMDFMVPALTVEPLVANAVKHGLRRSTDSGTVTLRTFQKDGYIYIEVGDNGVGMDTDRLDAMRQGGGEGKDWYMSFANVKRRLELQTGAGVSVKSALGKGTLVTVVIPKKNIEKTENSEERGAGSA